MVLFGFHLQETSLSQQMKCQCPSFKKEKAYKETMKQINDEHIMAESEIANADGDFMDLENPFKRKRII